MAGRILVQSRDADLLSRTRGRARSLVPPILPSPILLPRVTALSAYLSAQVCRFQTIARSLDLTVKYAVVGMQPLRHEHIN